MRYFQDSLRLQELIGESNTFIETDFPRKELRNIILLFVSEWTYATGMFDSLFLGEIGVLAKVISNFIMLCFEVKMRYL